MEAWARSEGSKFLDGLDCVEVGGMETPPGASSSISSCSSDPSSLWSCSESYSWARARADSTKALMGSAIVDDGGTLLLSSSSRSILMSSVCGAFVASGTSTCMTTLPALASFFRLASSAFCRLFSSISWRILSLYGARFGMPGSFFNRDRHWGS